jgi:hypothetical protein
MAMKRDGKHAWAVGDDVEWGGKQRGYERRPAYIQKKLRLPNGSNNFARCSDRVPHSIP